MATTVEMQRAGSFDIESIVTKPTWKQILVDLISSRKVDPWNVDIIEIADAYIKKIKEMRSVDLLIPANVILAASILLRYKSDYLKIQEENLQDIYAAEESLPSLVEDIPELNLVSRIPPKRQITMGELLEEMEKIIKYEGGFKVIKPRGGIEGVINISINEEDIEKRMGEVYERIKNNSDSEGLALFSKIIGKRDSHEIIYTLLSVLHLTQKQYIDIKQDDIFGEIFILVLKDKVKN
jgi:segregation and condensation protein A